MQTVNFGFFRVSYVIYIGLDTHTTVHIQRGFDFDRFFSVKKKLNKTEPNNHEPGFHGPLHQGGYRERHGQQSRAFD